MNKETFIIQLEKLLDDIPKEERDEAVDYYRCYFDDAGVENEALVIEELESPQVIADSIKEGLNAGENMSSFLKNPPQVREEQPQSHTYEYGKQPERGYGEGSQKHTASQSAFNQNIVGDSQNTSGEGVFGDSQSTSRDSQNSSFGENSSDGIFYKRYDQYKSGDSKAENEGSSSGGAFYKRYDQYKSRDAKAENEGSSSGGAFYKRYDQYEKKDGKISGMDRRTKLILLIVLAVCTLPVWGGIVSGIIGILGVVIAAVVILGVCSVGGVIGGIVCAIVGIVRLCTLSMVRGLVTLGIGMLLVAGGGLSIVALLLLCGRLLPWAVGQLAGLCRRLFKFVGRSMA